MASSDALYPSLDTPAILVDLDKLEANIAAMARMTAKAGLKLRPHTKVHKSTYVSEMQLDAGACGVSVSKLSEAAVYADAGQRDIMVVHPFSGDHKLAALKALIPRADISCAVDSVKGAEGISEVGRGAGVRVPVVLKIDTACHRFGVLPGEPALRIAKELARMSGIELAGIITHECVTDQTSVDGIERTAYESASTMSVTARALRDEGIPIKDVIAGATATARPLCEYASTFPEITEIHPGAYAFGDRVYINSFSIREEACAATVMVTVASTPNSSRACIDAGYKTLGADPMLFMAARSGGLDSWSPSYGSVKGRPDITVERLSEEIGVLALDDTSKGLEIGDRLEILPNHASLAVNLHDTMYGVRNGVVEQEIPVACRGMDQ